LRVPLPNDVDTMRSSDVPEISSRAGSAVFSTLTS
jgi:hypothetical protein